MMEGAGSLLWLVVGASRAGQNVHFIHERGYYVWANGKVYFEREGRDSSELDAIGSSTEAPVEAGPDDL
jgi:hypothetical protein